MKLVLVAAVMLLTTSTRLRSQVSSERSSLVQKTNFRYGTRFVGMVYVEPGSFCLVLGLLSNDPIFCNTPVVLPPQFLAQATTN